MLILLALLSVPAYSARRPIAQDPIHFLQRVALKVNKKCVGVIVDIFTDSYLVKYTCDNKTVIWKQLKLNELEVINNE